MNNKINKMEGREGREERGKGGGRKEGGRKLSGRGKGRIEEGCGGGGSVGKGGRVVRAVCPPPALWSQPKILSQF